uniref:Uncharacterized protein n=1 Tax=Plectus sambesii TaxID=2011161 RepID=A0A914VWM1_9BILA
MATVQLKVPPVSKTLEDPKPSNSPRPGKKLQRLKRLPVKERDDSLASSRMSDST